MPSSSKGRKVKALILTPLRALRNYFAISAVNGFQLFIHPMGDGFRLFRRITYGDPIGGGPDRLQISRPCGGFCIGLPSVIPLGRSGRA